MRERDRNEGAPASEELEEARGTRALLSMFDLIQAETGRPNRECFNQLVRFWADGLRVHPMPEEDHALADRLVAWARPFLEAAMRRKGDYFGEVFRLRECAAGRLSQLITPEPIVHLINEMTVGRLEAGEGQHTVLDLCTGTGRFLVDLAARYPDRDLFLHGVEIDLDLYRACLLNMRMYAWNRPYRILCADALIVDLEPASPNWRYANRWNPPDWRTAMVMADGRTWSQWMGEGGTSPPEGASGREGEPGEGGQGPFQRRLL